VNLELAALYEELGRKHCESFIERLEVLSTIITDSSREPWFLHFSWRNVSDRQALNLALMMNYLNLHPELVLERDRCFQFLALEAIQLIKRTLIRFKDIKKMPLIIRIVQSDKGVSFTLLSTIEGAYLPWREFKGNFKIASHRITDELLSIRFQTPRRLKKQEFRRGYRDHGTMISVSEKARRNANTFQDILWNEQIGNIVASPNPIKFARDHGIIPKEPENR
jgi:hypothetical protein